MALSKLDKSAVDALNMDFSDCVMMAGGALITKEVQARVAANLTGVKAVMQGAVYNLLLKML